MLQNSNLFKRAPKLLTILILGIFLIIGLFGLELSMQINSNGLMSDCVMMSSHELPGTLCPMSVAEHVAQWQQMFVSVEGKSINLLVALLMAVPLSGLIFTQLESFFSRAIIRFKQKGKCYQKEHIQIRLFDYLVRLFSRGIIHSQVYA